MSRVAWGGVLIGALAGLGITAALGIAAFAAGLRVGEGTVVDAAFILIQLFGQFAAGVFGGRFGGSPEAWHGALAALLLYSVTAVISLAGGAEAGPFVLGASGLVALVIGSAGGVLGARRPS